MAVYFRGWRTLPEWQIPEGFEPRTRVSVMIPARDEAANISECLSSIIQGSYPPHLLEIIVIDDFSEDGTAEQVLSFQAAAAGNPAIRLIRLSEVLPPEAGEVANKKKALQTGIAQARGTLIVTTDADCVAPKDWLRLVVSRFHPTPDPSPNGRGVPLTVLSTSPLPLGEGSACPAEGGRVGLLAAPVVFHREHNLFQRFQSLDFLGLMGISGAGIHCGFQRMGNGANLAFPKSVFEAVGGYSGNEHLSSGDDMFLVQKIAHHYPGSVFFLKNRGAAVMTTAKPDVRSFFQQRLRWGTKNAALPEWPVRLVLLTVFLFCSSILICAVWAVVSLPACHATVFSALLFQVAVKALCDYVFLREMCGYFGRKDLLRWFVPSFLLHTLYIPPAGAASLFLKKFEWKGRIVR